VNQLQSHKRQFKGTKAPRLFFDRTVRKTGNTKSLSLGKVIPASWSYVRIEIVDRDESSITVKITKLLETTQDAPDSNGNKRGKQNA
jgi:hypothetical protein